MELNDNQHYSLDLSSTNPANEKSAEKRFNDMQSRHKRYDQHKNKKRHRTKHRRYLTDKLSSSKFSNHPVNSSNVYNSRSSYHISNGRYHHHKSRSKKLKAYETYSKKLISPEILNNKEQRNGALDSVANKLRVNSHHSISKKLPVLACIELVKDLQQATASVNTSASFVDSKKLTSSNEKVLFKDYVLIPAGTPFKHLIYTVLDHVNFPSKNDYNVVDGYLKIENWQPIRLDSISSIVQCPLSAFSSPSSRSFTSSSTSLSTNLKQSQETVESATNNTIPKTETSNDDTNKSTTDNTKETTTTNSDKDAKTVTNIHNNNANSNHVNNTIKNASNSSSSINFQRSLSNTEHQRRASRPASIVSFSSSADSSSRNSSSSRSHGRRRRQRSFSSSSNNKHSEYEDTDYENDYDSDSNDDNNTDLKTSDSMTVNDMLSHVISFAELNIKLTVKNRCELPAQKPIGFLNQSYSNNTRHEDVEKRQQETSNSSSQSISQIQQQIQQRQQKLQQTNTTQQNLMQNYLMSLQKQGLDMNHQQQNQIHGYNTLHIGLDMNHQQQNQIQQNSPITGALASLIQNASVLTQQSQNSKQSPENEIQKKFNELLLPMLMMANSSAPTNSTSSPIPPQSSSPSFSTPTNTTSTSHLTNSQLASLLPILNLPILSQLLNSVNKTTNEQSQNTNGQQQQLNAANSLTRLMKSSEAAVGSLGYQIDSATSSLNQPLNLCKELSQAGGKSGSGQGFQSPSGINGKKHFGYPVPTNKSPSPPLSMVNNNNNNNSASSFSSKPDRNNFLSINVSGPSGAVTTNGNSTSVFNNSPSPSVSSSSSSSVSSTDKALAHQQKSHQQSAAQQSQHQKQSTSYSSSSTPVHSKPSYLINNRRQRERTTFDPQEEISRLMTIFERTHHPTRYQIASICDSLNSLSCRRDKKPLEPYNIQYWFKNARAALRRKVKGESSGDGNAIRTGGSSGTSSNNTTNGSGPGGNGKNANNSEFDMIFNNSGENLQASADYLNSKYSNYDEEENDLDEEEYDEDYDQENGNFSIDESNRLGGNVDLNNNHKHGADMNPFAGGDLIGSHKDIKSNGLENSEDTADHHLDHNSNQSEAYENYNEGNDTIDDEETSGQYMNSNYANIENSNENDDCNESYDDDHFKNNHSSMNSPSMNNTKNEHYHKNSSKGAINGGTGSMNNNSSMCNNRRNRVFIDPISEVPILEHYFSLETYPDHYLIEKICENLNKGEYRFKFPKLESRNIQLWFKNHRAKLKRLKSTPTSVSGNVNGSVGNSVNNAPDEHHHHHQPIIDSEKIRSGSFSMPGKINI